MEIGKIPHWLKRHLSVEEVEKISQAVAQAEAKTTGQIIPMVVRSSTAFGHVPAIITMILFSFALICELHHLEFWGQWPPWVTVPTLLGLCFGLGLILSQIAFLNRFLTLDQDEINAVAVRAELEFYRGSYGKTDKSTAVLLFVSWTEHRAIVLADKGIAEKLPANVWQEIVDILVKGIKQRQFAQAWEKAIERSGALLAEHFPVAPGAKNEIVDTLVIKD